jgi:hypothetical protein
MMMGAGMGRPAPGRRPTAPRPRRPPHRRHRPPRRSGTSPRTGRRKVPSAVRTLARWRPRAGFPATLWSGPPGRTAGPRPARSRNWRSFSPSCRRPRPRLPDVPCARRSRNIAIPAINAARSAALRAGPDAADLRYCGHVQDIPAPTCPPRARAGRADLRARWPTTCPPARWRRRASSTAPPAARRWNSTPPPIPAPARSAARPSSPTPARIATSSRSRPVPFRLTEAQANEAMTKWLGSLWFAPNGAGEIRPPRAAAGRALRALLDLRRRHRKRRYRGERGDAYYETRACAAPTARPRPAGAQDPLAAGAGRVRGFSTICW